MRNWKTLDAFERELLEDDEFREEYEKREPEYRIAREILATRRSIGMSQQDLARLIGTSQSRISKWERGEELPRLDNLQRIAEATGSTLHVSLEPTASSGRAGASRRATRKSSGRKKASGRKTSSRKSTGKRVAARKSSGRKKASGRKTTSRKSAEKRVAARKSTARKRTTERRGASRKAGPRRSSRK